MDLGFFVVMGVIGGLLGATFNCLNKRLAKYRMRNVHPKPKLVRYRLASPSLPWLPELRVDQAVSPEEGTCGNGLYFPRRL